MNYQFEKFFYNQTIIYPFNFDIDNFYINKIFMIFQKLLEFCLFMMEYKISDNNFKLEKNNNFLFLIEIIDNNPRIKLIFNQINAYEIN